MSMPVYATCSVCGQHKRILGRGACAADYQKYRRMGMLYLLPIGAIGRPLGYRPERKAAGR